MARLRLHNVRVPYGASLDAVSAAAAAKVGRSGEKLPGLRVARRSIDTRERPVIKWSMAVEFDGEESLIARLPQNEASVVEEAAVEPLVRGAEALGARPVVVGSGPAGLFAALVLAEQGYRPLVIERGREVSRRDEDVRALMTSGAIDPESNFVFGEGGAGTYSDGKLTTRSADPRMRRVLEVLVECGAPETILIDARPHIGSDLLPGVVTRLRRKIEELGGEFRFGARALRLVIENSRATGVETADGAIAAGAVILAAGTSARDLAEALDAQGVALEAKAFQIGVRIEHPQEMIDRGVYGRPRGDLPAAEYIMSCPATPRSRGVASFCMCPGGVIVPAVSRSGHLSTNGMSNSARDGRFANSALVVTVSPEDVGGGPLDGLRFQGQLEQAASDAGGDGRAPAQRARDFVDRRPSRDLPESSYPLGLVPADLRAFLPDYLTAALSACLPKLAGKMRGFVDRGLLVGVEARVSSPVRMVRDSATRESLSTGALYPAGEGSGYAGGIMTSAVDGMKSAEAVMRRFAPPAT